MADPAGTEPGASSSPLDSLFANLRRQTTASASPASQAQATYQQYPRQQTFQPTQARPASASFPAQLADADFSLNAASPAAPEMTPPATAAAGQSNADRATNLLNLLKFSQPKLGAQASPAAANLTQPQQVGERSDHRSAGSGPHDPSNANGRSISASDLVASFMSRPAAPAVESLPSAPPATGKLDLSRELPASTPSPSGQTQDFLLKLLNRPKPAQTESSSLAVQPETNAPNTDLTRLSQTLADVSLAQEQAVPSQVGPSASPVPGQASAHVFGSKENTAPSSFEPPLASQKGQQTLFTYVNPFEQLAASSPRNRTPKSQTPRPGNAGSGPPKFEILQNPRKVSPGGSANGTDTNKRKSKEPSPGPEQGFSRRKLATADDIHSSVASPAPAPLADGRSQIEALIGIGSSDKHVETVTEALSEVGGQVNQEVDDALARAEDEERRGLADKAVKGRPNEELQNAAAIIKEELDKGENRGALEQTLPEPVADAVRAVIDQTAADSWESADAEESPSKDDSDRLVRVYNFPIKPFVSLHLKPTPEPRPTLRDDSVMAIARLKKDFDQVDRTLATASEDFIVYGMSKHGGVRLIRQADGKDNQVFARTDDRVFNVSLSTAPSGLLPSGREAVLATGVSGSVYWVAIAKDNADLWEGDDVESHGFVFPPVASQEEHTSGTTLKTRAKTSSRHPDFFAVGRGKAIYIIWPAVAASPRYLGKRKDRIVDAEKYLQERCLRITTGKAGKDFAFSEDDSTIASLDKLGRLRIWDVRDLVDGSNGVIEDGQGYKIAPVEVKTPLVTFMTTAVAEKAWSSSVLFVDKSRPYLRGTAQRYIIVGMKQNHALQLWDLALGKAVQELHFPHNLESDAICSLAYHPGTGIIVVGHPTRNSIYLVHLSAPRYNLSPVSQARYVERIAQNDPSLPKPEATAIMSGVREYSFSNKGQIRSIDLLSHPTLSDEDSEDPVLFELYVMHSRGVSSLSIKRDDLGWSKDGRVVTPVDAETEGLIDVGELREAAAAPQNETAVNGERVVPATAPPTGKPTSKETAKKSVASNAQQIDATSASVARDTARAPASDAVHEQEKGEKKKKKRGEGSIRSDEPLAQTSTSAATPSRSHAQNTPSKHIKYQQKADAARTAEVAPKDPQPVPADISSANVAVSGDFLTRELRKIEKTVSADLTKVITRELENLYRRFDEDKRIQQASGDAKQDTVLRLVSSTLSDNVEKSLARMIGQSIQQAVIPAIADVTAASVHRNLSDVLRETLHHSVPRELKTALPDIVGRAFQNPDVLRVISDLVANKVATHVESEFSAILHGTISPAFKDLAVGTAQKIAGDLERRTAEQMRRAEVGRQNDSLKIDQLHELIRGLTQTVSRMADAQADFQSEILKLQRQLASAQSSSPVGHGKASRSSSRQQQHPSQQAVGPQKTPKQMELESVVALMEEGRYEEATIQWLQSSQQTELFDQFFARHGTAHLQFLSPLVSLSVAATVSATLQSNIRERLKWLEACFAHINPADSDVREVLPRIMDVLIQRLEGLYMSIAETNVQEPLLRKIPPLTRRARELKAAN
ncbi:MAG: hypothetical protein M1832_006056 [Thelocarpon impressellum]|nr:MAG: hypothetical protein M1832_006056 [Thelocarpon impressellum]